MKACIDSIIVQDYENIELIIIDDGSTDDSVQKIESMAPACIARFKRFEFRSRPNKGLAATINEGLEWSSGKYFAALASDDLLLANKTSSLLAHIEADEDLAGVFSGCELIDNAGSKVGRVRPQESYYFFDDIITHRYVIVAPSQLLRLQSVREVGAYPVGLYIEDWYMWLSLTKGGHKLKVVPDLLVQYRQHDSNISKNASKMFESRKWILGRFNDHPLYEFAMAQIHTSAAIDFSCVSKVQSAEYLIQAVSHNKRVIFTRAFISAFARLFAPCFVVKILARAKSRHQIKLIDAGNPVVSTAK